MCWKSASSHWFSQPPTLWRKVFAWTSFAQPRCMARLCRSSAMMSSMKCPCGLNCTQRWTLTQPGSWNLSTGCGVGLGNELNSWVASTVIYVLRLKHLQRIDVSHRCWPFNNQRHNLQHLTDCHTYFPAFSSLFQILVDDQSRRKCSGIVWVLTFLFEDQELEHLETFIILTKGFASRCELRWVDYSWICGHFPFVTVPWMLV